MPRKLIDVHSLHIVGTQICLNLVGKNTLMAQFTLSLKDKARCGYSPATVAGGEKQQARL